MLRNSRDPRGLTAFSLLLLLLGCNSPADSAEAAATTAQSAPPPARQAPAATPEPVRFGERFPAIEFANLNPEATDVAQVELGSVLGQRPIVLYYWIAGNPRADELFRELQSLVTELGADKLALYGVAMPRSERDLAAIADRVKSLDIRVPILNDEKMDVLARLRVQSVPNVTIIDGEGRLRLTNGASLSQDLEYNMDLQGAIRRVAETGKLGNYGFLDRYHPVKELIGKKCPDFKAPLLSNSVEQRWSTMIRDDQVNVLIFWSVDCGHCRKSLPEINTWLRENADGVNVISAASVRNETTKIKTKEFCDLNDFVFPTLVDQDLQIGELYQITATPTILIIRPDGVIDSVMLSGYTDFGRTISEKKKSLL